MGSGAVALEQDGDLGSIHIDLWANEAQVGGHGSAQSQVLNGQRPPAPTADASLTDLLVWDVSHLRMGEEKHPHFAFLREARLENRRALF